MNIHYNCVVDVKCFPYNVAVVVAIAGGGGGDGSCYDDDDNGYG